MKKKKIAVLAVLIFLIIIWATESAVFFIRAFSEKQIDDVTPGIPCEKELLEKSDILFVVPKFEGKGIGDNDEWCEEILLLEKKIEMHGVYHIYNEFQTERDANYLDEGIIEFVRCFGEKPSGFKAPQMKLLGENKKIIIERGLKNYGPINQLLHKTYHCNDSGIIPNSVIDLI